MGLFLVLYLLERSSGWREISQRLVGVHLGYAGLIVLTTLLHFSISAHKWKLVATKMKPEMVFRHGFLFYTGVIGLLANVMPLQGAVVAVRSLALRMHEKMPLSRGTLSSFYDQAFDLLIALMLVVPTVLALAQLVEAPVAAAISIAAIAAAGLFVCEFVLLLKNALNFAARSLPLGWSGGAGRLAAFAAAFSSLAEDRSMVRKLYWLSALRYANLSLRYCLIALAFGMKLPFLYIGLANSVIMLSFAISVTPASLGITEWGWLGVLRAFGLDGSLAADFAVLGRIGILGAVVLANVLIGLAIAVAWQLRLARDRSE